MDRIKYLAPLALLLAVSMAQANVPPPCPPCYSHWPYCDVFCSGVPNRVCCNNLCCNNSCCDEKNCYDNTQKHCCGYGNGTTCNNDQECCNGDCCTAGQSCCEGKTCFDPETEHCCWYEDGTICDNG